MRRIGEMRAAVKCNSIIGIVEFKSETDNVDDMVAVSFQRWCGGSCWKLTRCHLTTMSPLFSTHRLSHGGRG